MKANLCPVCMGKGLVYGIAEAGTMPTETCHGCGGKGWVEVSEDIPFVGGLPNPTVDYNKCPTCGGDRQDPPLTGCPKGSHYGTYCHTQEV